MRLPTSGTAIAAAAPEVQPPDHRREIRAARRRAPVTVGWDQPWRGSETMAEQGRTDRGGMFWVWATLAILVAVILGAWFMVRDKSADPGQATPPVETGATSEASPGASSRDPWQPRST